VRRVPYDRDKMVCVEMHLSSATFIKLIPFLLSACVDDGAPQAFGKSCLPIGAIVSMGEVCDNKSRGLQSNAKLVIYQARWLSIG